MKPRVLSKCLIINARVSESSCYEHSESLCVFTIPNYEIPAS